LETAASMLLKAKKNYREKTASVQEGAGLKNHYATQFLLLPVAPSCYFKPPITIFYLFCVS
jgi:hypothetical protein